MASSMRARGPVVDEVEMDVDEAFARGLRGARRRRLAQQPPETPVAVALDGEDRMGHEARLVALVHDLGERRVEKEGHVAVDRLDHRDLATPAVHLGLDVVEDDVGDRLGAGNAQVLEGAGREIGEGLGPVGREVLDRHPVEQAAQELGDHRLTAALGQPRGGCDGRPGALLDGGVHGVFDSPFRSRGRP
jgi:hypothetical protein